MMSLMIGSLIAMLLFAAPLQAQRPAVPSSSVSDQTAAAGAQTASRLVMTRTESNGREVITETTEGPDIDGKMKMLSETTTETVKTGPGSSTMKQEIYRNDGQGKRRLAEATEAETQTQSDGSSRRVANTFQPDANGRLGLSIREVQETRSVGPNATQTDTTIYHPGVNQSLRESERLLQTEQKVNANLTQTESTRSRRDSNGKWQVTETRSQEVRTAGNERVEEETVRRVNDSSGALEVSERKVTKQTKTGNTEESVTEIYSQNVGGLFRRADNRMELDRRVRVTTSGGQTIREVEGRNPLAPNEPLRVIEKTVETVREVAPGRWETQRQVFALDGNGRLVPILSEKGASTK
jgi:hypothetical protein